MCAEWWLRAPEIAGTSAALGGNYPAAVARHHDGRTDPLPEKVVTGPAVRSSQAEARAGILHVQKPRAEALGQRLRNEEGRKAHRPSRRNQLGSRQIEGVADA
jgi:hypothetical protein